MDTRRIGRWRALDPWIAAGFVAAAAVEALLRYHDQPVPLAINLPGAAVWTCLAWRRSRPLLVLAVIAAGGVVAALLQAWFGPDSSTNSDVAIVALLVASYSLGAHGSRRTVLLGSPLPVLVIVVTDLLQPSNEPLAKAVPFAICFVVLVPIAGGRLVRARAALVDRLHAQSAELAAHRGEQVEAELARERLRLSEDVHADLLSGMRALAEQATSGVADDGPRSAAAIEQAARALLARTREAVVALTRTAEPEPDAEPYPQPDQSRLPHAGAAPWTALAATALCAGLIVELHALPLHVPLAVASLACAPLVVPLALVWLNPVLMTAALWALAVLFDAYVASLSSSTAAIGLAFAAPFAVAALSGRRIALAGLVICCAGDALVYGATGAVAAMIVSAASWLAGAVLYDRSQLAERLQRNAALLRQQHAALAQRAVLMERMRAARDLHDAVGHSLTVVALQAGAARRLWSTDHARAVAALRTVAEVTRGGLSELQQSPTATGSLDALLAGARAAGLAIQTDVVEVPLDPQVREVVYRVVQESLTNVLKHAPGGTVRLVLRRWDGRVELTVVSTPSRATPPGAGTGRGLRGMRDRVTACGGQFESGPRPDGAFVVRAVLPLATAAVLS